MVRVLLKFSEKIVDAPITAQVILELGVPINILSAHISPQGGEMLVDIPSSHADKVIDTFQEMGVSCTLQKLIEVDSEKCFDCGACLSLCPVFAIAFKEYSVNFDEGKCIGKTCGLCVDACPTRAIKLLE